VRPSADTRLVAPFDGRVARTLVNNFQNVQAHQPVLVFQSTSILEVDIQVPEADMAAAERGLTARNARDLLEARVEFPTIPDRQFDLELKSFSAEATAVTRSFV
jgi:membrane fusion protein, multidrug efflux system